MTEIARVIAHDGLRLRDSPRDGMTLRVLAQDQRVEVLGRETWVRVRHGDAIGFVLADYIENVDDAVAPDTDAAGSDVEIIDVLPDATIRGAPLRIDRDFAPAIEGIRQLAQKEKLVVWITSSLREPYKPVNGAIVKPAQFSNHHVGHGIDMNLVDGTTFLRSTALGDFDNLPPAAKNFLVGVQDQLKLRWGGKFSTPDPVHIDDGLNLRDRVSFDRKLAALWGSRT